MLLVEHQEKRLLYSGDFKLGPSATAEVCQPPRADILVMESTWGDPRYRLPPRAAVIEQLLNRVDDAFRQQRTPVIHAYVLGKSQEVTKILTSAGIPVLQHPDIFEVSRIFEACGCALGTYQRYPGCPLPGHVVLAPPRMQKGYHLANLHRPVSISVTGWAVDARMSQRWNSDHVVPLSDHADYDQLLEFIDLVDPEVVHCTHGPASFVEHVRARGRRACVLGQPEKLLLF
jgi:Cft2 family RNA processing exonuclease